MKGNGLVRRLSEEGQKELAFAAQRPMKTGKRVVGGPGKKSARKSRKEPREKDSQKTRTSVIEREEEEVENHHRPVASGRRARVKKNLGGEE